MKQVARRLRDGSLELVEVPDPSPGPGSVAVAVEASLISSGTERATLDVARKNLVQKARQRPDQVKQVLERARTEGVRSTIDVVRHKLEQLGPLGYSAAGVVVEAGANVRTVAAGERVAIAGGGHANHAEVDIVPELLCARIPDEVSAEQAAFTTIGAVAMQGFRRAEATVGSTVTVIGLGLIGQLAVRIARAAGCRVVGVDLHEHLLELARAAGAETVPRAALDAPGPYDDAADAVLICASAPASDDPVRLAGQLARDRAPVVIVGDVQMSLPRPPYYNKELDLRLSRSYGPGRYDDAYELHGHDYPIGYVRWTEQRNMESFLALVAERRFDPLDLVTHTVPFAEAERAFELLNSDERPLGIVLDYGPAATRPRPRPPAPAEARPGPFAPTATPRFGLIGAGGFATATIVPGLLAAGFTPQAVASASGLSAADAGRRFGFATVCAAGEELIGRDDLDLVVIATQHDSHASLAAAALRRGIAVYVEKPLALSHAELADVRAAQRESGAPLLVGFNRTYSELAAPLRALPGPRLMAYRVNAGRLPAEHWTNDPLRGGGRLLGEGCHFVDFLCDQAGCDPVSVSARGFPSRPGLPLVATDNFNLQIDFADGSVGSLNYAADSPKGPGKERFETSSPGAYAVLDDFRTASIWSGATRTKLGGRGQDKGWEAQYAALATLLRSGEGAPDPERFYVSTLATLAAARSLQTGVAETVVEFELNPGSPAEPVDA